MLFLLSPAKSLDYEPPHQAIPSSEPLFVRDSAELIKTLKTHSSSDISALMSLSDNLAKLNVERYRAWAKTATPHNAKQALLAFNGDVYGGLNASSLSAAQLDWAQGHLCILSGLYGVLRPLDLMQPYRLEMGTALATARGANLYQFWGTQIADYLNQRALADTSPVVVNLASQEYFKAVDLKALAPRVVTCVFEEFKNDGYKVVSFFAKRARGLMARYAIEKKITSVKKLEGFDAEGYQFAPAASSQDKLVFRRKQT